MRRLITLLGSNGVQESLLRHFSPQLPLLSIIVSTDTSRRGAANDCHSITFCRICLDDGIGGLVRVCACVCGRSAFTRQGARACPWSAGSSSSICASSGCGLGWTCAGCDRRARFCCMSRSCSLIRCSGSCRDRFDRCVLVCPPDGQQSSSNASITSYAFSRDGRSGWWAASFVRNLRLRLKEGPPIL